MKMRWVGEEEGVLDLPTGSYKYCSIKLTNTGLPHPCPGVGCEAAAAGAGPDRGLGAAAAQGDPGPAEAQGLLQPPVRGRSHPQVRQLNSHNFLAALGARSWSAFSSDKF